jgi:hypothetical protein
LERKVHDLKRRRVAPHEAVRIREQLKTKATPQAMKQE